MLLALLLLAAAPAASTQTVCSKLADEFDQNEKQYAFWYDFESEYLALQTKWRDEDAAAHHEVALAQARLRGLRGTSGRSIVPSGGDEKVREARVKLRQTQTKYESQGDRITALMVGHKCKLPDHVTSWATYTKK